MKRLEMFSWQDYEAIKKHLEKMSLKGYKLKRTGFLWEYEKITPRMIHYDVAYFPERSEFNSKVTRDDIEYFGYCEAGGWEYISGNGQMRIFASEEEHPIPIETDEEDKYTCINKFGRREVGYSALLAFVLINLILRNLPLQEQMSERVSQLLLISAYGIGIGVLLMQMGSYWIWRIRSKRNLENKLPLPNRSMRVFLPVMWGLLIVMVVLSIFWFVSIIYTNIQYREMHSAIEHIFYLG